MLSQRLKPLILFLLITQMQVALLIGGSVAQAQAEEEDKAILIQDPEDPSDAGPEDSNRPRLTPAMIEAAAAELGIEPNSRHMHRILTAFYNPEEDTNIFINRDEAEDVERPAPKIIRHLRGKFGIPFPTKEEVVSPLKLEEEDFKRGLDTFFKATSTMVEKQMTVPEMPRCKEDRTTRVATGYKSTKDGKTLLMDMLFIEKDMVPLDPYEVFGKRAVVRPYVPGKSTAGGLAAVGAGVPCLPYRMRVTKEYTLRDEGLNAVRNYDTDPHGKGILTEIMRAKFNAGQ